MKIEALGFPVHMMAIEALCRDGGTYIAKNRGITFNGALIPVNHISDHWIKKYMKTKAEALHKALQTGEIPPQCKPRETWNGRKCEKYCSVKKACQNNLTINEINQRLVS